jgi:hypothetical protein
VKGGFSCFNDSFNGILRRNFETLFQGINKHVKEDKMKVVDKVYGPNSKDILEAFDALIDKEVNFSDLMPGSDIEHGPYPTGVLHKIKLKEFPYIATTGNCWKYVFTTKEVEKEKSEGPEFEIKEFFNSCMADKIATYYSAGYPKEFYFTNADFKDIKSGKSRGVKSTLSHVVGGSTYPYQAGDNIRHIVGYKNIFTIKEKPKKVIKTFDKNNAAEAIKYIGCKAGLSDISTQKAIDFLKESDYVLSGVAIAHGNCDNQFAPFFYNEDGIVLTHRYVAVEVDE